MNLCYRFTLLNENHANISKSPPSLNIAVWEAIEDLSLQSFQATFVTGFFSHNLASMKRYRDIGTQKLIPIKQALGDVHY